MSNQNNMLPYVGPEWFIRQYNKIEDMRLELWEKIYDLKRNDIEYDSNIDTNSLDSIATFDNNVLRVVVNDYLPRKCYVEKKNSQSLLRYHWLKTIVDAINKLKGDDVYPVFHKAHCIITTFLPRKIDWDVDNRVIKFIIDSLRYASVIRDDTADKLAYTVVGEFDKDNPRTEIVVVEYGKMKQLLADITM